MGHIPRKDRSNASSLQRTTVTDRTNPYLVNIDSSATPKEAESILVSDLAELESERSKLEKEYNKLPIVIEKSRAAR